MNTPSNVNIRLIAADVLFVRAKALCQAVENNDWPERMYHELREAVTLYEASIPIGIVTDPKDLEGKADVSE